MHRFQWVGVLFVLLLSACRSAPETASETKLSDGAAETPALERIDTRSQKNKVDSSAVEIGEGVEPDPEVVAMLAPFATTVKAMSERVAGVLAAPLERSRDTPESAMGNWAVDAMRDELGHLLGRKPDTKSLHSGMMGFPENP